MKSHGYSKEPEEKIISDANNNFISSQEFEYNVDLMLEEFKLFTNKFEFNENEKRIIESFVSDEKIKSNIKFIGWKDYWISI